jgi:tRNA 2-thiocytidine biosynthesis protein TtcA
MASQKYFVSKKVGKAIGEYDLIQNGDRIMVAVSGGKDSCALLHLLKYRQSFAPIDYSITAVYIDIGIPGFPVKKLVRHFEKEEIPYSIERCDALKSQSWDDINCFSCSRLRKKAIFEAADRLGFTKIATGHHLDDIAETMMMNLLFNGEISTMCPKQEFFGGRFTIIRPLAYLQAQDIMRFVKKENIFYIAKNKCPHSEDTNRIRIRKLLAQMEKVNPHIRKNILRALRNIKLDYLP